MIVLSEINLWLVGPEITKAGAKVQPKRVSTPPQLPTTTTMRFPGVSLKNAWDDAKTGWAFCSTNDGFYTKNDGLCASSCLCTPRAGKFTSNPHHNAISREKSEGFLHGRRTPVVARCFRGTLREFISAQPSLFTKDCKSTPTAGASTVVCGFNT